MLNQISNTPLDIPKNTEKQLFDLINNSQYIEVLNSGALIIDKYPSSPVLHTIFGITFLKINQIEKAISHLKLALKLNPINAKAHYYLGSALLSVNEFIVAENHLFKIKQRIPDNWRFANNFSSTISNCNISAPVHQDHANVKGAINMIITKRRNSKGGNLHVPDYNATFDQTDNSLLVYPAWRNRHGVTPIIPTHQGGYRNSHVWYALDSFHNLEK